MAKLKYKDFSQSMPMPMPVIRYRGVWDMQDLYEFMINYLRDKKYKFAERGYKHKHPSPFGIERQYVWEAKQIIDDVYLFTIEVFIHTYDAHDVSVKLPDGTTKIFTKGRIWITFNGKMEIYEHDTWKENRFWANLRFFINNYIKRKKHGYEVWDVLAYREIHKLVWLTRRRLKMENDDYEQKNWTGVHM